MMTTYERPRVVTYADGTRAVVAGPTDGAMEALVGGRLAVVGGWLCVISPGGSADLVALPHHATPVATDPLAFAVHDQTWRVGDEITCGGGVLDVSRDGPAEAAREWPGSALVFLQPPAPDTRAAIVRWSERVRLTIVNRWWYGLLDTLEARRQGARSHRDPDDR